MAYTNIDDPSAYFQAVLYTGTGSARSVTNNGNSDLQPDLVWAKNRNDAYNNVISDSNRGTTKTIVTDQTWAEITETHGLTSFDSNGFSIGGNAGGWNFSSAKTYVAWQWKANGGTNSSNTSGTITSTVQANTDAGISIVKYTTGTVGAGSGGYFSVGHGLGVTPDMVITKRLSGASDWWTWHTSLTNDTTSYVGLNSTAAEGNVGDMWGNGHTSSVFGGGAGSHYGSSNYIAYCFAEKQGFSKFGKYTGNANANGPFIYTGFKPALIIIKNASVVTHWAMIDNKRIGYNDDNYRLYPNLSNAENTTNTNLDILSNGFKLRTSDSDFNNGANIIYAAFAENPFVTSTGIPTTAR